MKKKIFLFFCCSMLIISSAVYADINVELSVKERMGISRSNEPITSGVPFAESDRVLSTDLLQVVDGGGRNIPAQFRTLARYHGLPTDETKPIRMLLVDFHADVPLHGEVKYYVKDNGSGAMEETPIASENATHIELSTGMLIAKISKESFNLFDGIFIDADGDGNIDDEIVGSNETDGIVIESEGISYTSQNTPNVVTIEENGPMRAVVKIKGYFKNAQGDLLIPELGDNGLSYTVRIRAYKGKPYVKVDYTLENENQAWAYTASDPIHNAYFDANYIKTTVADTTGDKSVVFDGYQDSFQAGSYELLQQEADNTAVHDYMWSYEIKKDAQTVSAGEQYDSYIALKDAEKGVMVASRWFWQNHPKGLAVRGNQVRFNVFPEIGKKHRYLGGLWKTTELIYCFSNDIEDYTQALGALKKRLIARCDDEHYAKTNFFDAMAPESVTVDHTFPAGEKMQDALNVFKNRYGALFDPSFISESAHNRNQSATLFDLRDTKGVLIDGNPRDASDPDNPWQWGSWYGWLAFGDMVRGSGYGHSGQHYDWPYVSMKYFLRFGDWRVFDLAEEMITHEADVLIMHDRFALQNSNLTEKLYHGGHRYEDDALMYYFDTHSASGRNNPKFGSHFWNRGTILQYFLTGDERLHDSVKDTVQHFHTALINNNYWGSALDALRFKGRGLHAFIDYYKISGDRTHLNYAWDVFEKGILPYEKTATFNGQEYYYLADSNNSMEGSILQSGVTWEPIIELYQACAAVGEQDRQERIALHLKRQSLWMRDVIYKYWQTADCGTYLNGEYFPYGQKKLWEPGDLQWPDGAYGNYYAPYVTDLFAFRFTRTQDQSWLQLARNVFKDFQFYSLSGKFYPIAMEPKEVSGFDSVLDNAYPAHAWAKIGQMYKKSMYYLHTEWLLSEQGEIPPQEPAEDLNNDGDVNIQDVIICVNAIISGMNTGDVNGDGETNIQDAIMIVNFILGN